jgi:hypothetical protein
MIASLESVIEETKSTRVCNALAQLHHAAACDKNIEDKSIIEDKEKESAKFYLISADQDDAIGCHWIGVFYQEGYGIQ